MAKAIVLVVGRMLLRPFNHVSSDKPQISQAVKIARRSPINRFPTGGRLLRSPVSETSLPLISLGHLRHIDLVQPSDFFVIK